MRAQKSVNRKINKPFGFHLQALGCGTSCQQVKHAQVHVRIFLSKKKGCQTLLADFLNRGDRWICQANGDE